MKSLSYNSSFVDRLEFLGDAVLDFLVTRHIFIVREDIKPGKYHH